MAINVKHFLHSPVILAGKPVADIYNNSRASIEMTPTAGMDIL